MLLPGQTKCVRTAHRIPVWTTADAAEVASPGRPTCHAGPDRKTPVNEYAPLLSGLQTVRQQDVNACLRAGSGFSSVRYILQLSFHTPGDVRCRVPSSVAAFNRRDLL